MTDNWGSVAVLQRNKYILEGVPNGGKFTYAKVNYDICIDDESSDLTSASSSLLYRILRLTSLGISIAFFVFLILAIFGISSVPWTVSTVGLLGSAGLTSAIWLSHRASYNIS